MNRLQSLREAGVSIWLDTLSRELLDSGDFARLVADCAVTGATSNPTIFAKAITGSDRYDDQLRAAVAAGVRTRDLFFELALEDVQRAADLLRPVYDDSDGRDGFVSFECTPDLADDAEATIEQALELWGRLARPNVMIKVPATEAGIPAIEELTARGVNVNVTLLFSVALRTGDGRLPGRPRARAAAGGWSARSRRWLRFFVSRVDSKVDPLLPADSGLRGRVAIANAQLAYARYLDRFSGIPASPTPAGAPSASRALVRNDRSGRAPARRIPPTRMSTTSSGSSLRAPSTRCLRPRSAPSRTTATCGTRSASRGRPTRPFAEPTPRASTSTPSQASSSATECALSATRITSFSTASRPSSKRPCRPTTALRGPGRGSRTVRTVGAAALNGRAPKKHTRGRPRSGGERRRVAPGPAAPGRL